MKPVPDVITAPAGEKPTMESLLALPLQLGQLVAKTLPRYQWPWRLDKSGAAGELQSECEIVWRGRERRLEGSGVAA